MKEKGLLVKVVKSRYRERWREGGREGGRGGGIKAGNTESQKSCSANVEKWTKK
jgi:hypothetical protein